MHKLHHHVICFHSTENRVHFLNLRVFLIFNMELFEKAHSLSS